MNRSARVALAFACQETDEVPIFEFCIDNREQG
jgi:hypothetical protein